MERSQTRRLLGANALRRVQSVPDEEMYAAATDAALFLAAAGFLDEANQLLERLWATGLPHPGDRWLPDQGFTVLWEAAGAAPANIPFERQPVDLIEIKHRAYVAADQWGVPMSSLPLSQLAGRDLLRRSCQLAYPRGAALPPAQDEAEALGGLVAYLSSPGLAESPGSWAVPKAACLAAELAARRGRRELAGELARRWAAWTARQEWIAWTLPSNRHLAPLLLGGVLARAYGLTPARARIFLAGLPGAIDRRLAQGRGLAYGDLSWGELLRRTSALRLRRHAEYYPAEEQAHGLGRPPCPPEELAAAEARLGLALPEDYRAFLLVSNGFGELRNTGALLPAARIAFLRDTLDPEALASYQSYPGDDVAEALAASLWISDHGEQDGMILLIPPGGAGADWATWHFSYKNPGEIRHPGFRAFIERLLLDAEAGDGLD